MGRINAKNASLNYRDKVKSKNIYIAQLDEPTEQLLVGHSNTEAFEKMESLIKQLQD